MAVIRNPALCAIIEQVAPGCTTTIDASTVLEDDLGITGGDAEDVMLAISTECGVDLTGFVFLRHFGPEASGPQLWWKPEEARDYGLFPVTVGHLEAVIAAGKWFDPERCDRRPVLLVRIWRRLSRRFSRHPNP